MPIKIFSRGQTRDPDGSRAFTIVPTVSFGGSPSAQYMTSMDFNGSTGKLILWRLRAVNGVLKLDAGAGQAAGPMVLSALGTTVSRECSRSQRQLGHGRPPADVLLLGR